MPHDHIFVSACLYIRLVARSGRFAPGAGRRLACLVALAAALLCLAPPAAGATKTWIAGSGRWDIIGNWSPSGQPQAGDDVKLTQKDATSRTVTYFNTTNPAAVLNSLKIDATGTGTMTLDIPNDHALNVTTEYVGYDGKAYVTQSDGTHNAATLYLGYNAGGDGTYTSGGGTLSSSGNQYIGYAGTGALKIQNGGHVSNGTGHLGYNSGAEGTATVTGDGSEWTSSGFIFVGESGTGTLSVEAGGCLSSLDGGLGWNLGATGTATVTGAGSKWAVVGGLCVGGFGSGALKIEAGGQVSDTWGYVGDANIAASTATVRVAGSGSKWSNSEELFVGMNGNATLTIEAGGQVVSGNSSIDGNTGSAVLVTGSGSTLANNGILGVGGTCRCTLTVSDGSKVQAERLDVCEVSAVRLHVSGNDMLILGVVAPSGIIFNNGTVSFFADAFLAEKDYRPISTYADDGIVWGGTGSYKAYGGTWSDADKTFTVAAPTELKAGDYDTLSTGERLLFTDVDSGKRVGASFGSVTGTPKFSAALMSQDELDALIGRPGFEGLVLSGWDFDTDFAGGDNVLLSFEIGLGAEDVGVWHYDGGAWTQYAADLETYDSSGIFSFTVTDFSGYAVTAIPEPATIALLGIACALAALRRRGR